MLNALVCVLPGLALLLLQILGKLNQITIQPGGIKANCLHSLRNGAFTARYGGALEELFHLTCAVLRSKVLNQILDETGEQETALKKGE